MGNVLLSLLAAIYFAPAVIAAAKKRYVWAIVATIAPGVPLALGDVLPYQVVWILSAALYLGIGYKILKKEQSEIE